MSLHVKTIDKKDPLITGGAIDPFDGFPFHPGDRVVMCDVCKTAHRVSSWQANGNHCTTLGCPGAGEALLPVTLSITADRPSFAPLIVIGTIVLCAVNALLAGIIAFQFLPRPTASSVNDAISAQETVAAMSVSQTSVAASTQQRLVALSATQTAVARPTATLQPTRITVVIEDDFNGFSLDSSTWVRDNDIGNNSATIESGFLRLVSNSTHYPYIYNRIPMRLAGDFRVTIRYRYNPYVPVGQGCGAGIMLTSGFVPVFRTGQEPNVQEPESEKVSFFIWHEVVWYDTFQYGRQKIALSTPYDGWHQATIEYHTGRYYVYRDNSRIFVSNSNPTKPRYIAFGNPQIVGASCIWDAVEIDYLKVEALP